MCIVSDYEKGGVGLASLVRIRRPSANGAESHSCGHDSLNACLGHRYLPNCNHKFTPMSKVVPGRADYY
jgi:hypothetical protein